MKSELAGGARHQSSLVEECNPEPARLQATVESLASSPSYFCLRRLSPARIKASEFGTGNFSKNLRGVLRERGQAIFAPYPRPTAYRR